VSQVLRIVYQKFRGKARHRAMEGKPRFVILYGPGGEVPKHVEVPYVPAPGRRGRADQAPPTHEQLGQLLDACRVHGDYASQMRNLITFAAFTGMRPGELFALEWADIDVKAMRIHVQRRVYRGSTDLPKSNKTRLIALTPPARDALLGQPRDGVLVFRAKRGGALSQPTLSGYWGNVLASAGLDFDFYLATKHYAVHHLYAELGA
jgi:integrase